MKTIAMCFDSNCMAAQIDDDGGAAIQNARARGAGYADMFGQFRGRIDSPELPEQFY